MVLALFVALAPLALGACGGVTEKAETTASASAGASGGMKDPRRGPKGEMEERADAAVDGAADAGDASGGAPPTSPIDPMSTCSICTRAENCCKAEGLTDCNYGSACASATPTEQSQFYLVLCRAVLEASRAGDKTRPDVCSF
jgi:hypothetical protein